MILATHMITGNQLPLPDAVRQALGDRVAFEIVDHQVVLRKAAPSAAEREIMGMALASEWLSAEDNIAYSDLSATGQLEKPQGNHPPTP